VAIPNSEEDEEEPEEPEKPKFFTLILVESIAKYGSVGGTEEWENPNLDRESFRAGLLGGQLTLGLLPGGKYFTMAARLSGGALLGGPNVQSSIGASMMFGANFLRNQKGNNFSYALGGVGVEFMPGLNEDMLAVHISGGTVIKGLSFSAGADFGGNDDIGFAMFGMQIGWGHLY